MTIYEDGREETIRHLLEAIEQVRRDMTKVELWASALNGFSRPVPDYELGNSTVWMPREQANNLKHSNTGKRKN